MIRIRKAAERGGANHGWLNTKHTFSFASYYDPAHMGFRALRVINDDRVVGGAGFPTHPHRDMEIISYVVEGALEHRDSMGNGSVIRPGDVQRMSAGTGVRHSEYNASETDPVRFLQIWIVPQERGGAPGYEQKDFSESRQGNLRLVASADGRDGSVAVRQDMNMFASVLAPGESVEHAVREGRHAWVQIVRGRVQLGEHELSEGDGAAINEATQLRIEATDEAEFLVFDLA